MDETGKRERDFPNCLFFICAGIGNIGEVGRWVARSKARDKTARQTECGKTLRVRVCVRVCAIRNIWEGEKLTKVDTKGMYPAVKGKKRRLAELLVNPDTELSISEICEQIGISRQTFYNWQNDDNFRSYVNWLIDSYTDSELANVWKALIKKAVAGDVAAQKLYMELKNKYKQQINVDGGVVIISGEEELDD